MALTDLEALRYIASHPDLIRALGADPNLGRAHFENNGRAEGRTITFDALRYIASYPDLIRSVGANEEAGTRQFITQGFADGRTATFDGLSYVASYADLANVFGADARGGAFHFVTSGFNEGRTITFNALNYVATFPDLIRNFGTDTIGATLHFINNGRFEGRAPGGFDALRYTASHADLVTAFGLNTEASTRHYIVNGFAEGRAVDFDSLAYIASHSDLLRLFGTNAVLGTRHYVTSGFNEGRTITFSPTLYLASNADLLAVYENDRNAATFHYVAVGFNEGRRLDFDPVGYLLSQPDLQALRFGPERALQHWVDFGIRENRLEGPYGREQVNNTLPFGSSISSALDRPGDNDWFGTNLVLGQQIRYTINLPSTAARPRLTLFDATGFQVAQVTGADGSATLDYTVPAGGLFYIAIADTAGNALPYTITAQTFRYERTGTAGPDFLVGTTGNDRIVGLEGNDTLFGRIGADVLEGGGGDDVLDGGAGNDTVFGGFEGSTRTGNDIINDSSGGNDQLFGQDGNDTITITRVGRTAVGSPLADGGSGNDVLRLVTDRITDSVTLNGGDGNDVLFLGDVANGVFSGGTGQDIVYFAPVAGVQSITLGPDLDVLIPTRPTSGPIRAGATVNVTDFRPGSDRMLFDEFLLAAPNWDRVTSPFAAGFLRLINVGNNATLQIDVDGGGDNYINFVTFFGRLANVFTAVELGWNPDGSPTAGRDFTVRSSSGERDYGSAGNDTILGLEGADTLDGRSGDDLIEGGAGNDQIEGGLGNDTLFGNTVSDATLEAGNDTLTDVLGGNDLLYGQAGNDVLRVVRTGSTPASIIVMDGGIGDDTLTLESDRFLENITAVGGEGDDVITIGGVQTALIDAGPGADRVTVNARGGVQTIFLGTGADTLAISGTGVGSVPVGARITVSDFNPAQDRLQLDDYLADVLLGWNRVSNPFDFYLRLAQSGSDTLLQVDRDGVDGLPFETLITFSGVAVGAFTSDSLGFAPNGAVTPGRLVVGNDLPQTLIGFGGNDTLQGFDGADLLQGLAGNDLLEGGLGADTLDGGLGDDTMYGHNAANGFLFDGSGDTLRDSAGGNDQLFGQDGNDILIVTRLGNVLGSTVLLDGGADNDTISFIADRLGDTVTVRGGSGNDEILVSMANLATIDAGVGNDRVTVSTRGGVYNVTLGAGADSIAPEVTVGSLAPISVIRVTDFQIGQDRVALDSYLEAALTTWDNGTNPFLGGFLRVVQSGTDAVLQIDRDGVAGATLGFETLMTFSNSTASAFGRNELGFAQDGTLGVPGQNGPGGSMLSPTIELLGELRTEHPILM